MNTSNIITAVVGNEKITIAEPITRVDYGLRLKIKGISLPDTYEVDFSKSEEGGESVTVIGNADGAEIPLFLIKTGKDIYAWLYWVGEGYGKRVKKIMIPNDAGPERTDIVPEPAEQSVIDQTIARLNEAVAHAPRIGDTGYWEIWDPEEGEYVNTGEKAGGTEEESGTRVYPLNGSTVETRNIVVAVGNPAYVDDVTQYADYGLTEKGWYVFTRIYAKEGGFVSVEGAAGFIASAGDDHVDVAVKFEVAATSKVVDINWVNYSERFVFQATDLAIRNLDYRVTFYVYDADEFATWLYKRSTDAVFVGTKYYTEESGVFSQAAVKAHDLVPADTYYTHAYVLADDEVFQEGVDYYTLEAGVYTPVEATAGEPLAPEGVDPAPVYYVDQYTLTTDTRFVGTRYYAEHDGEYEQIAVKAGDPCSYYNKVITYPLPGTTSFVGTEYWTPDESELGYSRAAVMAGETIPEGEYYTHAYQKLTAAGKFAEGVRYYKLVGTEYELQEVTVGASYAKNVYYIDQWTEQSGVFAGTAYYLKQDGNYVQVPVFGGETIPSAYYTQAINYALTADETFAVGKTYYIRNGNAFVEAEVGVGEAVTVGTYYEQIISWPQATGTFEDGVTYYTAPAGVYTEAEVTAGETIPDVEYCVQLISWPQDIDEEFNANETYYTLIDGEYIEAYAVPGARIPVNLVHDKVVIEGLVRNVTYRLNEIVDCPMEFILPVIEDETHGAWFEIRCRHAGAYSMTLVPQDNAVIATEHTQKETAGVNMINLHYTVVDGVKIWRFMNTHSSIPA